MNYLLSHSLMILVGEISKKKIHDHMLGERFLMFLQISFWSYKVKKTSSFDVLKDNKNIPIIILLSTNLFLRICFMKMYWERSGAYEEIEIVHRKWTSLHSKKAWQIMLLQDVSWAIRKGFNPFECKRPIKNKYLSHG